jgi:Ca2+/H+ antiporter, TMEM165/GDT1 family
MPWDLTHAGTAALGSFLASLVEFVEALTVVLAVGAVRGWPSALAGTGLALALLFAIIAIAGPALTSIPLQAVQAFVGMLLLLFGLRWLRKAILRAAGIIPLHDETAAFAKESETLRALGVAEVWDVVAIGTAFKIVMLEGIEVVFIVVAIGAGGQLMVPAATGAAAALALVILLGLLLHRPIATIPENTLKFVVGVLLSAFGTFWVAEGIGATWPGADLSLLALAAAYLAVALGCVRLARLAGRGKPVLRKTAA